MVNEATLCCCSEGFRLRVLVGAAEEGGWSGGKGEMRQWCESGLVAHSLAVFPGLVWWSILCEERRKEAGEEESRNVYSERQAHNAKTDLLFAGLLRSPPLRVHPLILLL